MRQQKNLETTDPPYVNCSVYTYIICGLEEACERETEREREKESERERGYPGEKRETVGIFRGAWAGTLHDS